MLDQAQQKEADDLARNLASLDGIGGRKFASGDYEGSAEAYREALRVPGLGKNLALKLGLARALEKIGPSEEALATLRSALEPRSSSLAQDPRELTRYGEMALSLHHPDEAEEAFRRAITVRKQPISFLPRIAAKMASLAQLQASAHVACGFQDMYQTSNAAAGSQFEKALAIVPDWPAVQLYRAENLRREGKRNDARAQFEILVSSHDKEVATIAAKQLKRVQ